ncbi:MAG: TadE/TadG family type IV pilus assembly protein, partial [Brevundimonas sp.]
MQNRISNMAESKARAGVAAVEFALVAPLFIGLLLA